MSPGTKGPTGAGRARRAGTARRVRPDVEALRRAVEELAAPPSSTRARGRRRDGGDEEVVAEAPTPLGTPAVADEGPWWQREGVGRPIRVEGGIVAATRRGAIGRTWWSERFLGALESLLAGGRAAAGRSYARKGQVLDLDVAPGVVASRVQGTRHEPYRVRLVLPVVDETEWDQILAALGAHAGHSARMLAGELPHEVEDVFADAGASLLPGPDARLSTECTCPDWENPCKHVAAVCYLLAERFDEDPFELLAWRGRTRADVLGRLREIRSASPAHDPGRQAAPGAQVATGPSVEDAGFWRAGGGLRDACTMPRAAQVPDALVRQLPRGLVALGRRDLADVLAPLYARLSEEAARRARR